METIVFYFITIAAVIFVTQKILFWLSILQRNNYQIGKTFKYLHVQNQYLNLFFGPENCIHVLLILAYFLTLIYAQTTTLYSIAVSLFFLYFLVKTCRQIARNQVVVPKIDLQVLVSFVIIFGVTIILFMFPLLDDFFWYLFIAKLMVFFMYALTIVLSIPKGFYKDFLIMRSNRKLSHLKKLATIVILGGKNSSELNTLLFEILKQKYSVIHSSGNGSIFEMSQTILKKASMNTDFLIVSLKDLEDQELKEVLQVLQPKICIFNSSDTDLKINNSSKAVEEFLSLMHPASIILSQGSPRFPDIYSKRKRNYFVAANTKNRKPKNQYVTNSEIIHKAFTSFVMLFPNQSVVRIKTHIINPQHIFDLETVIATCHELHIPSSALIKFVETIRPIEYKMSYVHAHNGAFVVCDSETNDLENTKKMLGNMRGITGKKIVVFAPNAEFGKLQEKNIKQVFSEMREFTEKVYIVNPHPSNMNSHTALRSRLIVDKAPKILELIKKKLHKNDVVVCVGMKGEEIFHALNSSNAA